MFYLLHISLLFFSISMCIYIYILKYRCLKIIFSQSLRIIFEIVEVKTTIKKYIILSIKDPLFYWLKKWKRRTWHNKNVSRFYFPPTDKITLPTLVSFPSCRFPFYSEKASVSKPRKLKVAWEKLNRPRCVWWSCQASNMYLCSSFCSWLWWIASKSLDPTLNSYHKMKVPFISFFLINFLLWFLFC